MPDLLTHALVMYVVVTVASWRVEWLTPAYVTVAMMGAMIPDMTKIELLLPSHRVESVIGIPFDWFALHTLGGSLVSVLIGAVLVPRKHRTRVASLLALGAASHLLLDALLVNPSGRSYALLWPLTAYHPPTPGLYLSTDRWPALVAGALAALVWVRTRRLRAGRGS
ncbi:metal-dependent hydrolase [Halalkalicoccus sp. NIPERK01]|uniref:metal-dependent hydrolase n=1 Tax=Halalkalicoccus sp. NIPERK01 TaxID=3053469 RepID=UPI00256F5F04|nr:metal-dependent hydrolase [Halalkalicoccus sp. NIPERK01]MDL5363294.1 metal-dependent hydrolase [Halalkalicoccus sp. NIPERK01]